MSRFLTYLLVALAIVLTYGCCMEDTLIVNPPNRQKVFHARGHVAITNQVPDTIEEVDVEAKGKPTINISPAVIASITPYAPTYIPATIECIVRRQCPVFIVQHELLI